MSHVRRANGKPAGRQSAAFQRLDRSIRKKEKFLQRKDGIGELMTRLVAKGLVLFRNGQKSRGQSL
jgi:hypothetical protein